MRRLVWILNLVVPLERLNKDFLRQILGIIRAAYHPVNLQIDPPQVRLDEFLTRPLGR